MRKTKCKSCNGRGGIMKLGEDIGCSDCQGTGEISVYTIQELRDGKVVAKSDGDAEISARVMNYADKTNGNWAGYKAYYWFENGIGTSAGERPKNLPIQSVKIFLEEIEHEEKEQYANERGLVNRHAGFKADPIVEEPEFKWGEWVESDLKPGVLAKYVERYPMQSGGHVIVYPETYNEDEFYTVVNHVRKPQKITLTLSQIAEKFNCKPEQIKIVE